MKMAMKNTRNSNSLNFIGEIDKVAAAESKAIANPNRSIQPEEDDGAAGIYVQVYMVQENTFGQGGQAINVHKYGDFKIYVLIFI